MSNIYDMIDTWNAGGTTFTAIKMNVTDTASAAGSLLMDLQVGGTSKFKVSKAGRINATDFEMSDYMLGLRIFLRDDAAAINFGAADDLKIIRDAANVLAQRNGVNAQAFRIYNTFTDASNYERSSVVWSGNILFIGTEKAGTGAARQVFVGSNPSGSGDALLGLVGASISFYSGAGVAWQMSTSNHLLAGTDNSFDIGAAGASRPRTGYFGTSVVAPAHQTPDLTVAGLPVAAAGNKGQRRHVTDANATTFASTVAGGGANIVPVFSNGTNWIIG